MDPRLLHGRVIEARFSGLSFLLQTVIGENWLRDRIKVPFRVKIASFKVSSWKIK